MASGVEQVLVAALNLLAYVCCYPIRINTCTLSDYSVFFTAYLVISSRNQDA